LDEPIEFADNKYVRPGTAIGNQNNNYDQSHKQKRIFSGIPESK